ncbi:MAG: 50S ribosomal protein L29 [Candidatus Omnitrophota bacterium]|jgi:large subunit ribosomal protein L29|nr:50S ribosomal protein L29 [Candidatus Omnitrophota bacterium]
MLKVAELRNLSDQELKEKMVVLKKSLFEMRNAKATRRIEKPSKVKDARRDIARILTILHEKKEK